MGRPRKYDWDDKRDVCWKLWTEDKLTGPQIVKWFAAHFQIPVSDLPNANQFHQKFHEWGFPSRRIKRAEEEEARLLARTRDLFAQNMPAQDIQKILNDEGWGMDNYHFRTFRKKYGMLKRNLNGYRRPPEPKRKRKRGEDEDEAAEGADEEDEEENEPEAEPAPLPPEEAARRAQRLADIQLQSDELLHTRKRRRRIRGLGHLPPDDPSIAPRYGSETSLDECKAYLNLSNEMYVQLRGDYAAICRDMGITKMTLCAEGQWQASKDRLVLGNMHLSSMLHPLQPDLDRRLNALNCICSDVTKRMRNEAKAMTIAQASNLLGLDPITSKEMRRVYYEMLEADHFTTALACGKEHLNELRDAWCAQFDVLQQAMASGDAQRIRAVELLCRDARKRFGDDRVRKDPTQKQWQKHKVYGPGPGPAHGLVPKKASTTRLPPVTTPPPPITATENTTIPAANPQPSSRFGKAANGHPMIPMGPSWFGRENEMPEFRTSTIADIGGSGAAIDFDLDPLLSETTHGPPWPPQDNNSRPTPWPAAPSANPATTTSTTNPATSTSAAAAGAPTSSVPAYFRLAPASNVTGHHPPMWLGKLTSGATFASLKRAATSKAGAARLVKVHGIVKDVEAGGAEDSWLIENDEELGVYLSEAGEKATFVVLLEGGYA